MKKVIYAGVWGHYGSGYSLPRVLLPAKGVAVGDGPLLLTSRGTLVAVLIINPFKSPVIYHLIHYLNV